MHVAPRIFSTAPYMLNIMPQTCSIWCPIHTRLRGCPRRASDDVPYISHTCHRYASDNIPDTPERMPHTCPRWCPRQALCISKWSPSGQVVTLRSPATGSYTATDWPKCFSITRLKCSKLSGTGRGWKSLNATLLWTPLCSARKSWRDENENEYNTICANESKMENIENEKVFQDSHCRKPLSSKNSINKRYFLHSFWLPSCSKQSSIAKLSNNPLERIAMMINKLESKSWDEYQRRLGSKT